MQTVCANAKSIDFKCLWANVFGQEIFCSCNLFRTCSENITAYVIRKICDAKINLIFAKSGIEEDDVLILCGLNF